MSGSVQTVSLEGIKHLHETLDGIERRASDTRLAAPFVFAELEAGEEALFKRANGLWVNTGRTRKSLTEPEGEDAIRRLLGGGQGFVFGSKVWYAIFLKKDSTPGQTAKGMMSKKSAVLISPIIASRVAGRALLSYVRFGAKSKLDLIESIL
jgi:hypothetical protein